MEVAAAAVAWKLDTTVSFLKCFFFTMLNKKCCSFYEEIRNAVCEKINKKCESQTMFNYFVYKN